MAAPTAVAKPRLSQPIVLGLPEAQQSMPRAASGIGARTVDVLTGNLGNVQPLIPPQYLPYLINQAVINPLVAETVRLTVANANQGHAIVLETPTQSEAEIARAQAVLEAFSERVQTQGGGIDGLINTLIAQASVAGALSAECVISPDRHHVARIEVVPVQDIWFDRGPDGWVAVQLAGSKRVTLDPRTYSYSALQVLEGNPYGIPPFAAAINAILRDAEMLKAEDSMLAKAGWLGVLALTLPEWNKPLGQAEDEWDREKLAKAQGVIDNVAGGLRNRLIVFERGMDLDYKAAPRTELMGAGGPREANLHLICAGLGIDPSMLGFVFAKTETWLGVARSSLEAKCETIQRLVATLLAHALKLEYQLQGLDVSAWVNFDATPRMRPAEEATARATLWGTIKNMAINGALDPDEGMREMGYDGWADLTRLPNNEGLDSQSLWSFVKEAVREGGLTPEDGAAMMGWDKWADTSRISNPAADAQQAGGLMFRWDGGRGYRRCPARRSSRETMAEARGKMGKIMLATLRGIVKHRVVGAVPAPVALSRSRRLRRAYAKGPGAAVLRRLVARFLARYAGRIAPMFDRMQAEMFQDLGAAIAAAPEGTWRDEAEFGTWALDQLQASFGEKWRDYGADDFESNVLKTHEDMSRAWSSEDRAKLAADNLPDDMTDVGEVDTNASRALTANDTFHMSIYLKDLQGNERKAFETMLSEEFVKSGRDITDPDVRDEMLNRLERSGGLLLKRREHGREGTETPAEALDRMAPRVRRIVETTTMRSQNVADVLNIADAEVFETFRYVANQPQDDPEHVCAQLDGKEFPVAAAAASMREWLAMSPEDQEATLTAHRDLSAEARASIPFAQQPPIHPFCSCQLEAIL